MIRPLGFAKNAIALLSLFVLPVATASCSSCQKSDNGRMRVVVSIFPIYDLVRKVAGPDADVVLLLPPGKSEHTFDPTPKQIGEVASAKLGVEVGLNLDPWMEKLLADAAPKARVLKLGDRVPTRNIEDETVGHDQVHGDHDEDHDHGHEHEDHEKGAIDPHVWLDPERARFMVKAIGEELARIDGAHAEGYRTRVAQADSALDALDKEAMAKTKTFTKREFITFHQSFGYFAERYKLKIAAAIEPFPGRSPTGPYIAEVLKIVNEKKVPALFSEPQLDPKPAQTIAEAAKIPLGVLDPVGGSPETDSYEKLIRFNVASLEKYLK